MQPQQYFVLFHFQRVCLLRWCWINLPRTADIMSHLCEGFCLLCWQDWKSYICTIQSLLYAFSFAMFDHNMILSYKDYSPDIRGPIEWKPIISVALQQIPCLKDFIMMLSVLINSRARSLVLTWSKGSNLRLKTAVQSWNWTSLYFDISAIIPERPGVYFNETEH